MESVDRYRSEMMEHIPERDDDTLFNYHKLTVERLMKNVDKVKLTMGASCTRNISRGLMNMLW